MHKILTTSLKDEPTTGLDSVMALKLLSCVRAITATGKVGCLCALLQPPREVFTLFDNVMIVNDGELAYFGPREEVIPCMLAALHYPVFFLHSVIFMRRL